MKRSLEPRTKDKSEFEVAHSDECRVIPFITSWIYRILSEL